MNTWHDSLIQQSHQLLDALQEAVAHPPFDDTRRLRLSATSCSLAMEHGSAAIELLALGLLPSAAVVHRCQFDALVRALWILYAASDEQVEALDQAFDLDSERAAARSPGTEGMIGQLELKAPPNAVTPLREFKDHNGRALNSYVHAGLHPLKRHTSPESLALSIDVLKNVNGLVVLSAMLAAIHTGVPGLQKEVLAVAQGFDGCLRKA
jgi:hypothetical protein